MESRAVRKALCCVLWPVLGPQHSGTGDCPTFELNLAMCVEAEKHREQFQAAWVLRPRSMDLVNSPGVHRESEVSARSGP